MRTRRVDRSIRTAREPLEACQGPDLDREEVRRDDRVPMLCEKLLPGRLPNPVWSGLDTVAPQNIGDLAARNMMVKICQRALYPQIRR